MMIICQQTILIKYHALFVKIWNSGLLQIIGELLWVKSFLILAYVSFTVNDQQHKPVWKVLG